MKRDRHSKLFNNISLWNKLIVIFIILSLSIFIVGFNLTARLNRSYFENTINLTDTSLNQIKNNTIGKLNDWAKIIPIMINNKSVTQYINQSFQSDYEAYDSYMANIAPFLEIVNAENSVDYIKIYSNNPTIRTSMLTNNQISSLHNEPWYNESSISKYGYNWGLTKLGSFGQTPYYLNIFKEQFKDKSSKELKSVYAAFVNELKLFKLISEEAKVGNIVIILDKDNHILSSTERSMVGKTINDFELSIGYSNKLLAVHSNTIIKVNKKQYLFKFTTIDIDELSIADWKIVYMIPAESILSESKFIWYSSIFLCIICFTVSSLLVMTVSKNITTRVHALITKMRTVKEGNFDTEIDISGNDEIGVLERNFNDMVSRVSLLITEVYESDLKAKNAEIKHQKIQKMMREVEIISLQSQINPHYLFNTLETVRMELVIQKQRELADVIKAFADGFRTYVHDERKIYMLNDEMKLLQNFLLVQNYRHGNRIRFKVDIDESLYNCRIPKLILQPLLENAVFHGAEPKAGNSLVEVRVFRTANDIIATVYDNGVGMDNDEINRLRERIYGSEENENSWSNGGYSALRNVHSRISLMYGLQYGLSFESKKEEYSLFKINLPFSEKQTEGDEVV
ncbi:sensor histidine kinase [Paenibacillus eucommiae]|uniref:Two-component system sensor histidine kinase YesM n=1 Tax=Paenibacillus eucommiae TaxID=1355755 RepID=A0ABS4J8A6_9BACL|nr:histidine kinase [Paenibacillus eucommiae]MBP1996078.1 two-component system sensor histidine kinase YesM [Paenibacillus eucommiae]